METVKTVCGSSDLSAGFYSGVLYIFDMNVFYYYSV